MMNPLFLLSFLLLLGTILTTTETPTIGVTLDPKTPNIPPLSSVVTALVHHNISTIHLINPTPSSIHFFTNKNITLLISIPNTFLYAFATDQSSSSTWISNNILPFHNTTRISLITLDTTTSVSRFHLPALRNLHTNLHKLGVTNIPLSITFPFAVDTTWFTPPQTELIRDLVGFLNTTDSLFFVLLFPYKVNVSRYDETPLELAPFAAMRSNLTDPVAATEADVFLKGLMDQMRMGNMEKSLRLKYDPGFFFTGFEAVVRFYNLVMKTVLCGLISVFVACLVLWVGSAMWSKTKKRT